MTVIDGKNLTAGLEDYLEAIYAAAVENKSMKGAELAKELGVSRASVSEALSKLASKGFIAYESHGIIMLTPEGIYKARQVYDTHNILKSFFVTVLGINPDEAGKNACKIEHIISENILNEIKNFTSYCIKNPDFIAKYRKK